MNVEFRKFIDKLVNEWQLDGVEGSAEMVAIALLESGYTAEILLTLGFDANLISRLTSSITIDEAISMIEYQEFLIEGEIAEGGFSPWDIHGAGLKLRYLEWLRTDISELQDVVYAPFSRIDLKIHLEEEVPMIAINRLEDIQNEMRDWYTNTRIEL